MDEWVLFLECTVTFNYLTIGSKGFAYKLHSTMDECLFFRGGGGGGGQTKSLISELGISFVHVSVRGYSR